MKANTLLAVVICAALIGGGFLHYAILSPKAEDSVEVEPVALAAEPTHKIMVGGCVTYGDGGTFCRTSRVQLKTTLCEELFTPFIMRVIGDASYYEVTGFRTTVDGQEILAIINGAQAVPTNCLVLVD